MQLLGMPNFIVHHEKKEEKRQKGQRPTGIEPRPRGDRAGFGSLGQPIPDRKVPLDTAPVVEWLGAISRPQPHATSHTDAGRQNTQTPSRKAKRIVKRGKKKLIRPTIHLGVQRRSYCAPGFPLGISLRVPTARTCDGWGLRVGHPGLRAVSESS
ncbi:hypothetical protein J3E69DRAFT_118098 [Trichoderma sp. SZMC 28015]